MSLTLLFPKRSFCLRWSQETVRRAAASDSAASSCTCWCGLSVWPASAWAPWGSTTCQRFEKTCAENEVEPDTNFMYICKTTCEVSQHCTTKITLIISFLCSLYTSPFFVLSDVFDCIFEKAYVKMEVELSKILNPNDTVTLTGLFLICLMFTSHEHHLFFLFTFKNCALPILNNNKLHSYRTFSKTRVTLWLLCAESFDSPQCRWRLCGGRILVSVTVRTSLPEDLKICKCSRGIKKISNATRSLKLDQHNLIINHKKRGDKSSDHCFAISRISNNFKYSF